MKICYVDESGCTGMLPTNTSDIQPVLTVLGLIFDYSKLHYMTDRLLHLKQRFYPKLAPQATTHLGWMLQEVKGSDLRKAICSGSRNGRRHSIGYLSEIVKLCKECDVKICGRVWIKGIGTPVNGTSIYSYSIQSIYATFQDYLTFNGDMGFVILDSRLKYLNTPVAHSIFTQKFKGAGDSYDRIVELPAFSHSDNHAGLQIADTVCSSIINPMAITTYCTGRVANLHVRPGYSRIKSTFAADCKALQHRYAEASGVKRGGLIVSDGLGNRPGGLMFR